MIIIKNGKYSEFKISSDIRNGEKVLLLATGITLPLLTLRVELPVYTITFYLFFISLLMMYFYIKRFSSERRPIVFYINSLDILISIFFLIITLSLLYSVDQLYAIMRWSKLLISVIFYFLLKTVLVEKPLYFETISKYAVITLFFYLGILGYYYLVVFNADYIGMELQYETKAGRNSLAFMVCILLAFSLCYTFENIKTKTSMIIRLLMFTLLIIGIFLIQSRGLFIIFCIYLLLYFLLTKVNFKNLLKVLLILFLLYSLGNIFISADIKQSVQNRFYSLLVFVDNEYVTEYTGTSITVRSDLVERGIELFSESPILGVGLGSFMTHGSTQFPISHNDYILVLSEQGIIGLLTFLLFLGSFIKLAYNNLKRQNTPTNQGLFLSICGISVYLLFINAYDNLLFWTIIAAISANGFHLHNKNNTKGNDCRIYAFGSQKKY